MAIDAIMLNPADNVATAVQVLKAGQKADVRLGHDIKQVLIGEDIPYGHKIAVYSIRKGQDIIKYGEVIGRATQDILAGHHAHVQNIESLRGRGDLQKEA
ncbi:UxaA family hydrolase [Sporomusa acidovorans]|uniref:Altronate dehydratase n=1 Tax=Sporomusa acidovorans (strain ATCC 49682 / DSM 3132 / Mol) TaxID=1123286 RepID=A0ABZ3IYI3_SPOA4|nr:UxaA family hydrolase [Sporomusa acidovorans]OZC22223.1 altronate dehydratase [Sporomusa acidovorans DSM 3132]SDE81297.1 altronate dehydratase small subunit [Sporomusa acidovorans]